MAGTLTISTLSDGTNSTSATNCIQGSAKAWVNLNGSTGAVRTSYNVSSVTRTGTGTYTVTFTNAFVDANYAVSLGTINWGLDLNIANANTTTTMYLVNFNTTTGNNTDSTVVCASVFR